MDKKCEQLIFNKIKVKEAVKNVFFGSIYSIVDIFIIFTSMMY